MESLGKSTLVARYVEAKTFPACVCGESWTSHGACGGYQPSKPIELRSNDTVVNILFKLEQFFYKLRIARVRNL